MGESETNKVGYWEVTAIGIGLCLSALASLLWQTAGRAPQRLWIPAAMVGISFLVEAAFRAATGRTLRLSKPSKESASNTRKGRRT